MTKVKAFVSYGRWRRRGKTTVLRIFVGWLVVLRIYVALAVFQPYLDLEAGDNQSLKIQVWRRRIEPRTSCSARQELNHSTTAAPLRIFVSEWDWLFNVTCNDSSVIHVTEHRYAGGLKKLNLRSGSQRHRHFVGFCNVPVQAPALANLLYGYSEKPPHLVAFTTSWGYGGHILDLPPPPLPGFSRGTGYS